MKSKEKTKKSFILYNDFATMFFMLSLADRGRLISEIFNYVNADGESDELPATVKMAFAFIKNTLDRDRAAYEEKCAQNAANGQKGGRPRKSEKSESAAMGSGDFFEAKTERFFSKPKKADNDNDSETDIETDTDSGTESENEIETDNDSGTESGTGNEGRLSELLLSEKGSAHAPLKSEVFKKEDFPMDTPGKFSKENSPLAMPEKQSDGGGASDKTELEEIPRGIPESYIAERLERLRAFASKSGRSVAEVAAEWWSRESGAVKRRHGKRAGAVKEMPPPESFDVDDFFAAALTRSRSSG